MGRTRSRWIPILGCLLLGQATCGAPPPGPPTSPSAQSGPGAAASGQAVASAVASLDPRTIPDDPDALPTFAKRWDLRRADEQQAPPRALLLSRETGVVVLPGPSANELRGVGGRSGEPRWTLAVPRGSWQPAEPWGGAEVDLDAVESDGTMYLSVAGELSAVDLRTGALHWHAPLPARPSRRILAVAGRTLLYQAQPTVATGALTCIAR